MCGLAARAPDLVEMIKARQAEEMTRKETMMLPFERVDTCMMSLTFKDTTISPIN